MIIYPAIDMIGGKCVRLQQGKYDSVSTYGDPLELAVKWKNAGAEWIHLVDLDGARKGMLLNIEVASEIARRLDIPVQLGGGIRSLDNVKAVLNKGISRVILGTAAVKNPELVQKAVELFGEKIAVGIDAKDSYVAVEGWEETSNISASGLALRMQQSGVKTIIYTDISTDGMLKGPNIKAMSDMAELLDIDVIASGGVSCIEDIIELSKTGVSGAIVGKALYTGNVDLAGALEKVGGKKC